MCPTPALKITVCHSAPSQRTLKKIHFYFCPSVLNFARKSTHFGGKKTLFKCNRISFDVKSIVILWTMFSNRSCIKKNSPDIM